MSQQLVMGSPEAENIRELDAMVAEWLAKTHPCPQCYDDVPPEDVTITLPDRCCRLCDGSGEVTGAEIEAWARSIRRAWPLPSWFPITWETGR